MWLQAVIVAVVPIHAPLIVGLGSTRRHKLDTDLAETPLRVRISRSTAETPWLERHAARTLAFTNTSGVDAVDAQYTRRGRRRDDPMWVSRLGRPSGVNVGSLSAHTVLQAALNGDSTWPWCRWGVLFTVWRQGNWSHYWRQGCCGRTASAMEQAKAASRLELEKLLHARADCCHFSWVTMNGFPTVKMMLLRRAIHLFKEKDERSATDCINMSRSRPLET